MLTQREGTGGREARPGGRSLHVRTPPCRDPWPAALLRAPAGASVAALGRAGAAVAWDVGAAAAAVAVAAVAARREALLELAERALERVQEARGSAAADM